MRQRLGRRIFQGKDSQRGERMELRQNSTGPQFRKQQRAVESGRYTQISQVGASESQGI